VSQKRCDEESIKKKLFWFKLLLKVYIIILQVYTLCIDVYRLTPVHDGTHCELYQSVIIYIMTIIVISIINCSIIV